MALEKKYSVKLNNIDKIEQLLQETYNLSCQQYFSLQNEINKIANTTVVNDLDIDGKEKYGKIMKEYIALQQKAINQKMDIAKLMTEVIKHNGNIKETFEDENAKKSITSLNFDELRRIATAASSNGEGEIETYTTKPKNR